MTFAVFSTTIEKFRSEKIVIQPKSKHRKEKHAKKRRLSKQKRNITKNVINLWRLIINFFEIAGASK